MWRKGRKAAPAGRAGAVRTAANVLRSVDGRLPNAGPAHGHHAPEHFAADMDEAHAEVDHGEHQQNRDEVGI